MISLKYTVLLFAIFVPMATCVVPYYVERAHMLNSTATEKKNTEMSKSRCSLKVAHYVPFYPSSGNLFVPSRKGYLEDVIYLYWKSTNWSNKLTRMPKDSALFGGQEIRRTGVYHMYFQVTFRASGQVGIAIEALYPHRQHRQKSKDQLHRLMVCTTFAGSTNSVASCYTSSTQYLKKGVVLFFKPLYGEQDFSLLPANTFWGLTKLR